MARERQKTIPESMDGMRLDKACAALFPDIGTRGARRLLESGALLLDGRPCRKGHMVGRGQIITVTEPERAVISLDILARTWDFAAVDKPPSTHSAAISGRSGSSAEASLPALFPDSDPVLLNRLDYLTSGILLVAFSKNAADHFRRLEAAGEVEKVYAAVVDGKMEHDAVVKNRLDTAKRTMTKVLPESDPDPTRWTRVVPVRHGSWSTLVRVLIHRGARHQIRAHLASSGHPILGDPLYGGPEADRLYLHHEKLSLGDFQAHSPATGFEPV